MNRIIKVTNNLNKNTIKVFSKRLGEQIHFLFKDSNSKRIIEVERVTDRHQN